MTENLREQLRLAPEELRWQCDFAKFTFRTTEEVLPLEDFVGQDSAIEAIEFGLALEKPGFNIFVTGLTGTGKASLIHSYVNRAVARRIAAGDTQPVFDWCYVYNFDDQDKPLPLRLPPGAGGEFKDDVANILRRTRKFLSQSFNTQRYEKASQQLAAELQADQQALWSEVDNLAREHGFLLQLSGNDMAFVPLVDGKPITQEQVANLSQEQRHGFDVAHSELSQKVSVKMKRLQELQRDAADDMVELEQRTAEAAIKNAFRLALAKYAEQKDVRRFLEGLRQFASRNVSALRGLDSETDPPARHTPNPGEPERALLPFNVALFVDNSKTEGAPIISESNPTAANLFGRVEHRFVAGGYVTDHTMIRAGALARANGGYLILPAREVFGYLGVWAGLKRALRSNEAHIEDPGEIIGTSTMPGLKPAPIPLDVKVILLSDDVLYRLAWISDEDFAELFKVKAEFDRDIDRNDENLSVYVSFIATSCRNEELLPANPTGVCAVLEEAARLVPNQQKLSTRFGLVRDLLIEADHWARLAGATAIAGEHVEQAITARRGRVNNVQRRVREMVAEGVMLDLGDIAFGAPSRITARTYAGRTGVINIEREANLSGSTHDKGVLILAGLLGGLYAQDTPLALSATLAFEQSYSGVDGDSASSAELYAILSSLSGLPIDQSLAVTGSVNQRGQVQAIGGVNEKIEGFFDVCARKGLTGRQGVIIPKANVRHLMLRGNVISAVREGQFHIYAVDSIDQGIELLTGVPAGARDASGAYPEGSVNALVETEIKRLAAAVRRQDR